MWLLPRKKHKKRRKNTEKRDVKEEKQVSTNCYTQ